MADTPINSTPRLPVIAIVGRPNVGKSSLFNAILGRRLAIVHEMAGVTRDRVAASAVRNGRRFTLIDTGGLGMLAGESRKVDVWDSAIAVQVDAAIRSADVLIFVADAAAGLTPLDSDVAARIRTAGKPILMAANKCDNEEMRNHAAEFSALGFGEVYATSCLHRGGVARLIDDALKLLPGTTLPAEPPLPAIRIAVVGRPNVGKSSLVNALIGDERVMTGPVAGTTRDAVDVEFTFSSRGETHRAILVDTAGLRKRAKVDTVVEYFSVMRAKSAVERADMVILVMEADPDGMTAQDRRIAGLIQDSGKGCVIALNKSDLYEPRVAKSLLAELRTSLPQLAYVPAVLISAAKRRNLEALLEAVTDVMAQLGHEITTGALNRVLHDAFESNPPPIIGRAPLKFFYASMTGVRPPRIRLFVNDPAFAADYYITFLKKQLRAAFDMGSVPIEIELRARPKRVETIRRSAPAKNNRGPRKRR